MLRAPTPTRAHLLALAVLAASFAGCRGLDVPVPKVPGVTPHRIVIQQGNFISQEMVSQLKPGMSREQVRFVLGTPLVSDIFHADRWDYVYFLELPNGKREQRNLAVIFQDGKLTRVVGDLMPTETSKPAAAAFPSQKPDESKPAPKPEPVQAKPAAPAAPAEAPPAEAAKADTVPNWRAASEAPAEQVKPEAEAPPKPVAETNEKKEPGFFESMRERVREKLGL
jgi:outer membrane protein assembly factor BamE